MVYVVACKVESFSFSFFASSVCLFVFSIQEKKKIMFLSSSLAELLASKWEFLWHLMHPTEAWN